MAKHRLKRAGGAVYATILVLIVLGSSSCGTRDSAEKAQAPPLNDKPKIRPLTDVVFEPTESRRKRGKYLAEGLLQCFLCHTDRDWKAPGAPPIQNRKGSGHVWSDDGEFRLVAPNITPDKETGAGTWTDDMFARAIREGISREGRVLHPQMWYTSFRSLSDEDLASVIVYLRSIPAVRNLLPPTKLRKEPELEQEPLTGPVTQPDASDPVKRGNYLVKVADCVGCHTAWEAPLNPGFFAGGNLMVAGVPLDDGEPTPAHGNAPTAELQKERAFSANLTPAPAGISYYDDTLFVNVMRTGHVKARKLSSIMPWTVFRNLDDDDLKAIFAYLRARRPVNHAVDNTEPPSDCAMCSQKHGFGDRNHPKVENVVTVDPETYDAYVGRYRFDDGFTVIILKEDDKLKIQFPNDESKLELLPISATEFTAKEIPDVISFVRGEHGRITHLVSNVDDVGKKME